MRRRCAVKFSITSGILAITWPLIAATALPQQSAGPAKTQQGSSLDDSLQELAARVRELSSMLGQMGAEVARSRAEAAELRQELEGTREQLTSLKRELGAVREQSKPPVLPPGSTAASGTTPPSPRESLDQRLPRIEEEQQLLGAKIEDQYQTKVESASKYRVRLSGIALLDVFGTSGSVDSVDLPSRARRRLPLETNGSFGATARQSLLGLEVFGPNVAGGKSSADLEFDFFGGFPNAQDGVTAGLVRLRVARLRLDWPRTSIVAGQDAPFFSPLSPTSLASLAYPALSYAGNLWTWTPQIRVEHRLNLTEPSSILLQAGILDPLTGEPPGDPFYRSADAGERGRQPAYASRFAWSHSAFGRPLTLGVGGYYARQNWGFGRTVDAWAGTADWTVPLGPGISLTGEFYRGRAIGGLGGALGRSVLWNGPLADRRSSVVGLNTTGGWAQLKIKPFEKLELNGAFGEDFPSPSDLRLFSRSGSYLPASIGRNQSAFVNSIYHARSNLLLSIEYRRLWTSDILAPKSIANQIALSAGVLF